MPEIEIEFKSKEQEDHVRSQALGLFNQLGSLITSEVTTSLIEREFEKTYTLREKIFNYKKYKNTSLHNKIINFYLVNILKREIDR